MDFLERVVVGRKISRHPDLFRAASPIARVHRDAPPFLVIHGSADTVIPVAQARSFAIVTSPMARRALSRLFRPHLPETPVLSFLEIPDGKPVEVVAVVGNEARIGRPERVAAA